MAPGWFRMKSIRWLSGGEGVSLASLLCAAAVLGCGLQEYPRAGNHGLATGGTMGTTGTMGTAEPPAMVDAAATPPDDRPPPDAGTGPEAGASRLDAMAPPVSGPGVMIDG